MSGWRTNILIERTNLQVSYGTGVGTPFTWPMPHTNTGVLLHATPTRAEKQATQ